MPYLAQDIANFVLDHVEQKGISPTNLWLNKILFFLHSTHLMERGEPLLRNRFNAWQYGPVVRPIYEQFKRFGREPIRNARALRLNPETGLMEYFEPRLSPADAEFLRTNLDPYLDTTAGYLVEKSHQPGSPWDDIWQAAEKDVVPGMWITDELIVRKARAIMN